MSHLTPDEIVDAVDGALTGAPHDHLLACTTCRESAEQLRRLLTEVQAGDLPEPSPLFWTHLSARVRQAVLDEETPRPPWHPVWLRWSVLTPVTALALIVAALVVSAPQGRSSSGAVTTTTVEQALALDDPLPLDDGSWRLVVDMVDGLEDLDQAPHDGLIVTPGLADRAAGDLRPSERAELVRLLRAELVERINER